MSQDLEYIKARLDRNETTMDNLYKLVQRVESDSLANDQALRFMVSEFGKQLDSLQKSQSVGRGEITQVKQLLSKLIGLLERREANRKNRGWE
jgi:ribosomal protein S4